MIQVHPARSSRITHLHIYMYTYIHIYVSLYTHLCTIIFILGTLYRSRISCDACLGGLNAIARACCLTFTPPPIIVDIRHTWMWTPAHVVSRLCYIMYVCIHGRMPGWITDGHVCGWNIVVSGNRNTRGCVYACAYSCPLYRIMSWVMCFLRILEEVNARCLWIWSSAVAYFPLSIPIVIFSVFLPLTYDN